MRYPSDRIFIFSRYIDSISDYKNIRLDSLFIAAEYRRWSAFVMASELI